MNIYKFNYLVAGGSLVFLCTGCTWFGDSNSVQDIHIDDRSATTAAVEFNYHHDTGRNITQVQLQRVNISDELNIHAATNSSGQGEERLRNTRKQDASENQFVGVGEVNADYELQRATVRHIFRLDASGHFQLDLAPQLSLMQLDSKYSTRQAHMSLDLDRFGGGLFFNTRWVFTDYLSLNLAADHTFYEGNTAGSTHMVFFRVQPGKRFHVDIGKYFSEYDFGDDTRISYERRVSEQFPCGDECTYAYDGTENSDLDFDMSGYRIALGFDF